jgi:gingipain R
MNVQRLYRSSNPTPPIVSRIEQGVALVNYSGHGNVTTWAGPIFSSENALGLHNQNRLPIVTVMDCLNGYFSDPLVEGLAESLLKAPDGGAIASFASSGETGAIPQHEMGERMFQLIYATPSMPIGDASRQAKSATQDLDVRRTWILFGDPTMKIR